MTRVDGPVCVRAVRAVPCAAAGALGLRRARIQGLRSKGLGIDLLYKILGRAAGRLFLGSGKRGCCVWGRGAAALLWHRGAGRDCRVTRARPLRRSVGSWAGLIKSMLVAPPEAITSIIIHFNNMKGIKVYARGCAFLQTLCRVATVPA